MNLWVNTRDFSFTCYLKENHNDNGIKRSHWTVTVNGSKAQIDGILRIQVHYYEDGNVQLLSKKDATHELSVESGIFDQKSVIGEGCLIILWRARI